MLILLVYKEWVLKMIEINKILLICIVNSGQVIYYRVMMDIHRNINMLIGIILQVIKMMEGLKQQQ